MKRMMNLSLVFSLTAALTAAVTAAMVQSCKTSGNKPAAPNAVAADSSDDIPVLKLDSLNPAMIARIVSIARRDAVAIFGGEALFHLMIFDNGIDEGPCRGAFGLRVIFANPDEQAEPIRAFAMFTVDPAQSSENGCSNSITAGPKGARDVKANLAGTKNMENSLGGISLIKLSLAEAVKKLKANNPKFEVPLMVSIMNPSEDIMKKFPWAMIYGKSCGEEGVAYVNLSTGTVMSASEPMRRDCR